MSYEVVGSCTYEEEDTCHMRWLGLAPATLEFWVRFPNERNQEKQAHPVLKYRVPHGSHFVIGPAVINTHTKRHFLRGT